VIGYPAVTHAGGENPYKRRQIARSPEDDVVLDTSVIRRPLRGVDEIRSFFTATRVMYETIGFTDEGWSANKIWLEWEGTVFGG
jgi:hypothetical protein